MPAWPCLWDRWFASFPEYAAAKREVDAGHLGEVAVVRLKRNVFRPRKAQDNWFLDHEKSGGMILDLMIHDFDYARWVAGEVVSVYAKQLGDPGSIHRRSLPGHPDARQRSHQPRRRLVGLPAAHLSHQL